MNTPPPPKLLPRLREHLRTRHYSIRTEEAYADWVKRFILFHHKRHPKDMGAAEVEAFFDAFGSTPAGISIDTKSGQISAALPLQASAANRIALAR